jgi:hypothetical protein
VGFWQAFFLTGNPTLNEFWSPLVGPIISMLSFVCSIGNVPLAAVLWNGGHQLRWGNQLHLRRPAAARASDLPDRAARCRGEP